MLKCTNKGHLIIRLHVMPYLNAFPHSSLISFFFLIIAQYWTTILSAWVFSFAVLCLVAQLYPTLCNPIDCSPPSSSVHWDFPGKNTGMDCHFLLQGIFPTEGSNLGLLHCRQILYCLSHQGVTFPSDAMLKPKQPLWPIQQISLCVSHCPCLLAEVL